MITAEDILNKHIKGAYDYNYDNVIAALNEALLANKIDVPICTDVKEGDLQDFIEGRDVVVANYIKWMGNNFEDCDKKGLLQAGFREGVQWLEHRLSGRKYIG